MKNLKMYESGDKMISIIQDNYNILQALNAFGINLGFGERTVEEVCNQQKVDSATFLAVINFMINGYHDPNVVERLSVPTLLRYLKASHIYFVDFQLPFIRKELADALDANDNLGRLILQLYDEYAQDVTSHMRFEDKKVFPYVQKLLDGDSNAEYDIDTFSKHHGQINKKLKELKNIIIKYLPSDVLRNNQLMATLYDIYNNEEWLQLHGDVENEILIPAIHALERKSRQDDTSIKLSHMIQQSAQKGDQLSEREKDVIKALVQGMTNKEIADHLCISTNTVITHRRNIARKLQIHSPAGLTIYAIANKLVDISVLKL